MPQTPPGNAQTSGVTNEAPLASEDAIRQKQIDELVEQSKKIDFSKPETIPTNFLSGQVRRLEVHGKDPNFEYHWFNDDKGGMNISSAIRSGWVFEDRKDVQLNAAAIPRNNDLGSRVRQVVGSDERGGPMYAYLMKIPKELWLHHQTGPGSREEYHRKLMSQIVEGTLGEKQGEMRYSANRPFRNSPGTLPGISVSTSISRHKTESTR
jgi:hypothetical protein